MSATTFYNSTNLVGIGTLNAASVSTTLANVITANIQSMNVTGDSNLAGNLITQNIIMSSNLSTNTGFGNVYLTGNLVVAGNIFSIGGSVGSGSGTSQGVTYVLPSSYSLGSSFATGTAGPGIAGYHINLGSFGAQAVQAVSSFSASSGMLKFTSVGLYQIQCVLVGDQPAAKVGVGSTSSSSFPPSVTATSGYVYVYNYPLNSSPTTLVTIPLTITDVSKWYYLDAYFSTVAGSPTVLYQTAPTGGSAVGSNYGTYVQVGPFGNYLTSATGVASGLLANCTASSNLSGSYSSNTYRITLNSSNGWTVNGISTAISVTSNGNFTFNQAGLYEVNMCLNTVGVTPTQFQVGSLSSDTLSPSGTTPYYLYTYAPMYTQDPTTAIKLPLNITNTANVYFVECSFQGTQSANISLSTTSTFISLKPVGSYVTPTTNPWLQQGTTVYYNSGQVGLGVNPSAVTETFTVSGNTSFVGNVVTVGDTAGGLYVNAKRVPAGSLSVSSYVTGSVPLTTTTSLIQNYLSNAAAITSNTGTGTITQALSVQGASSGASGLNMGNGNSLRFSNLATSNLFIEMWVNLAGLGRFQDIIQRSTLTSPSDFAIYIHSLNYPVFYVSNATSLVTVNGSTISAGTWTHIAASYVRSSLTQGTLYIFVNGTLNNSAAFGSATGSQANVTSTANIYMFNDVGSSSYFSGNVADVRVMTGSVVPTASFTTAAAPFTVAPTYVTGMSTGYSSNLTLALQSQYFPGASTSPYGPCLTLPGTVGSYYTQASTADNTVFSSNGFTFEYWVNYASFANTTYPQIGKVSPTDAGFSWRFDSNVNAGVTFIYYNGGFVSAYGGSTQLVTGRWNHCAVQSNGTNIYIFINGVLVSTTAVSGTPATPTAPITIGQQNNATGGNFAIAKARLVYGNDTSAASKAAANVYSSGNFTANPNFAAVPAGATVAWQLESQYPLPTYPSIQDVTQLSAQTTAYGSLPTPVGGVTSNALSPYSTTYPQLQSLRFDGTGYVDYGNAASSSLTTNLWANSWTIEGWIYPQNSGNYQSLMARGVDWGVLFDNSNVLRFVYGATQAYYGYIPPFNTWSHFAIVYDGTNISTYGAGVRQGQAAASASNMTFVPTANVQVGYSYGFSNYFTGNMADVRISNVAVYTGTSPGAPSAPFTTNANTLLLLKSLNQQVGQTLEVQGRGLNSTSIGAGRNIYSFPPAPMSSYLLDTTSNASVTYGQGKYVASASSDSLSGASNYAAWNAFGIIGVATAWVTPGTPYSGNPPYGPTTSTSTVDTIGNAYAGEWLQIQLPVSVLLTKYQLNPGNAGLTTQVPAKWWVLGSRDGINWTLIHSVTGWSGFATMTYSTFQLGATQAYNYYRLVVNQLIGAGTIAVVAQWTLNGTEEALCVSNDSKIGVGIANPQRSLEVAGDLVTGGTVSAGNPLMYRNRVINGDMRIAQRGTSNTIPLVSATYYLIDRFNIQANMSAGSITQYQNTLTVSDTPYQYGFRYASNIVVNSAVTASYVVPGYFIEGYTIQDLNWGTSFGSPVTLSFWFRTNAPTGSQFNMNIGNYGSGNTNYNMVINANSGVWQYYTFTVPPPPNGSSWGTGSSGSLQLYICPVNSASVTSASSAWTGAYTLYGNYPWINYAGTYIAITGIQLEKGTIATPWEQRPYATELALCQRYYQQFGGNAFTRFAAGGAYSTVGAHLALPALVTMRANPTTISNSAVTSFYLEYGASSITPTSLSCSSAAPNNISVDVGVASGLTAGGAVVLIANNTTAAFLGFSAEL